MLTPSSSENLPEEKAEEDLKMGGDNPTPEEEVTRLQNELRQAKAAEKRLQQERDLANSQLDTAEKGRRDAEATAQRLQTENQPGDSNSGGGRSKKITLKLTCPSLDTAQNYSTWSKAYRIWKGACKAENWTSIQMAHALISIINDEHPIKKGLFTALMSVMTDQECDNPSLEKVEQFLKDQLGTEDHVNTFSIFKNFISAEIAPGERYTDFTTRWDTLYESMMRRDPAMKIAEKVLSMMVRHAAKLTDTANMNIRANLDFEGAGVYKATLKMINQVCEGQVYQGAKTAQVKLCTDTGEHTVTYEAGCFIINGSKMLTEEQNQVLVMAAKNNRRQNGRGAGRGTGRGGGVTGGADGQPEEERKKPHTRGCYVCGKPGHFAAVCRQKKGNRETEGDTEEVNAVGDTGEYWTITEDLSAVTVTEDEMRQEPERHQHGWLKEISTAPKPDKKERIKELEEAVRSLKMEQEKEKESLPPGVVKVGPGCFTVYSLDAADERRNPEINKTRRRNIPKPGKPVLRNLAGQTRLMEDWEDGQDDPDDGWQEMQEAKRRAAKKAEAEAWFQLRGSETSHYEHCNMVTEEELGEEDPDEEETREEPEHHQHGWMRSVEANKPEDAEAGEDEETKALRRSLSFQPLILTPPREANTEQDDTESSDPASSPDSSDTSTEMILTEIEPREKKKEKLMQQVWEMQRRGDTTPPGYVRVPHIDGEIAWDLLTERHEAKKREKNLDLSHSPQLMIDEGAEAEPTHREDEENNDPQIVADTPAQVPTITRAEKARRLGKKMRTCKVRLRRLTAADILRAENGIPDRPATRAGSIFDIAGLKPSKGRGEEEGSARTRSHHRGRGQLAQLQWWGGEEEEPIVISSSEEAEQISSDEEVDEQLIADLLKDSDEEPGREETVFMVEDTDLEEEEIPEQQPEHHQHGWRQEVTQTKMDPDEVGELPEQQVWDKTEQERKEETKKKLDDITSRLLTMVKADKGKADKQKDDEQKEMKKEEITSGTFLFSDGHRVRKIDVADLTHVEKLLIEDPAFQARWTEDMERQEGGASTCHSWALMGTEWTGVLVQPVVHPHVTPQSVWTQQGTTGSNLKVSTDKHDMAGINLTSLPFLWSDELDVVDNEAETEDSDEEALARGAQAAFKRFQPSRHPAIPPSRLYHPLDASDPEIPHPFPEVIRPQLQKLLPTYQSWSRSQFRKPEKRDDKEKCHGKDDMKGYKSNKSPGTDTGRVIGVKPNKLTRARPSNMQNRDVNAGVNALDIKRAVEDAINQHVGGFIDNIVGAVINGIQQQPVQQQLAQDQPPQGEDHQETGVADQQQELGDQGWDDQEDHQEVVADHQGGEADQQEAGASGTVNPDEQNVLGTIARDYKRPDDKCHGPGCQNYLRGKKNTNTRVCYLCVEKNKDNL